MRDATNNRWVVLTAGHCIPEALRTTSFDITHNGFRVGTYRANSAVNQTISGVLHDVAIVDLDPGQQTGLVMHVGVPIHSNPEARAHAGFDYIEAYEQPTLGSGEMLCLEGASFIRDEAPYVNAAALRGAMQTVCGSEAGETSDLLRQVRWWGNGFAAGQGWGEVSCNGDSGGFLRRPGSTWALGILSRQTIERPDLVTNPNTTTRTCGYYGMFFGVGVARDYYLPRGIDLRLEDGLSMVKSIRNVTTGNCLGRPGGSHYPGLAIVQQACPAEWRIFPVNRIAWSGTEPYGDDVNMIEHWGVCLNGISSSAVNQAGCPGGPGSFPYAYEMFWRIRQTADNSFALNSEYFSGYLNSTGASAVGIGTLSTSSRWRVG